MDAKSETIIPALLETNHERLLADWLREQGETGALRGRLVGEGELADHSKRFLAALRHGIGGGRFADLMAPEWQATRDVLAEVARRRATQGFTPSETATFVFSMKRPLFNLLHEACGRDREQLGRETWTATLLLDKLGLYTTELYQRSREEVIERQQQELLELSTPVVQLWEGILALPLIGTLDSARTQTVMENLLQEIVASGAETAIIDITGVPTVDTLVAQHLIKTVSAARLMGADCIISGIRPQIAQTIVHLGLELDVVSKATMADAFALALRRSGRLVVDRAPSSPERG